MYTQNRITLQTLYVGDQTAHGNDQGAQNGTREGSFSFHHFHVSFSGAKSVGSRKPPQNGPRQLFPAAHVARTREQLIDYELAQGLQRSRPKPRQGAEALGEIGAGLLHPASPAPPPDRDEEELAG